MAKDANLIILHNDYWVLFTPERFIPAFASPRKRNVNLESNRKLCPNAAIQNTV